MRSHYLLIAIAFLYLFQEVFQTQAQSRTLWQPHRKSFTYKIREHEEFHFLTNLAVVTTLSFFKHLKILVQHLLLGEADTIDACHHRTLFITTPISRTYSRHLNSLNRSCAQQVRTTAKVCIVTLRIGSDMSVFQFFNQLILISLTTFSKELNSI